MAAVKILSRLSNISSSSKFISLKYSTTILVQDFSFKSQKNIFSFITHPTADRVKFDLPCLKDYPKLNIQGHIHGLVCLSHLNDIFLCNPFTEEVFQLPPSPIYYSYDYKQIECEFLTTALGFGYDHKSNDFKVLRVYTIQIPTTAEYVCFSRYRRYCKSYRFEVYNFSANQWTRIKTPLLNRSLDHISSGVYHEGVYYFFAFFAHHDACFILAFDMTEEVFQTITMPDMSIYGRNSSLKLDVWNGSIVLFIYPLEVESRYEVLPTFSVENAIDVWVMEKDESWTKVLRIGPHFLGIWPLLFLNSGEILIKEEDGEEVCYDINTRNIKKFPLNSHSDCLKCCIYEKSLLSCQLQRRGNKS